MPDFHCADEMDFEPESFMGLPHGEERILRGE
jgi:hypothetical protein